MTEGGAELYDYRWFFSPFFGNRLRPDGPNDDETNPKDGYFPRRGVDLWTTRYFILPAVNANHERRPIYSFLYDTDAITPRKEELEGDAGKAFFDKWMQAED